MRRLFALLAASPPALLLAGSCIHRGYPLSTSGGVDIRVDVAGALFAADSLDPDGPRQSPHETGVTLTLTEGDEPAFGGYVDVQVSPPEALSLEADPSEANPTCVAQQGGLRCTADEDGHARLLARSRGTWSGAAGVRVLYGGNAPKERAITILPAGLPAEASDFRLVVDGLSLDQAARVLATYEALTCTQDTVPGDLGSTWREGAIRAREARVLAAAPPDRPGVLLDAPVQISSLGADAALSTSKDCKARSPLLRTRLDEHGQSPAFYLCFSDAGGAARFSVSSGVKRLDPAPSITVDPEPKLLRVRALQSQVKVGTAPIGLFEISAYDADRQRIALPVDVRADSPSVLGLGALSLTLSSEDGPATVLQAVPLQAGSSSIHVSPRLLAQPDCASTVVTVVP